ncbi:MAG: DinB family protein [Gammaproteobacteria bacterium]
MLLKDAIAALKLMPETLQRHVTGLTDAQLHFQPEGGYFSVLENVCHLRDIEIEGYGMRLRRLLAEEHPTLPDLDGAQLARERRYREQTLQPVLDAFVQARGANLKVLENVTDAQLARTGYLEPVGEITLSRLLELWVEHDQGHSQELGKLQNTFRGSNTVHATDTSLNPGRT